MSAEFCPQCGSQRTGSFRFCRSCGLDFDALRSSESETAGLRTKVVPRRASGQSERLRSDANMANPGATIRARRWSNSRIAGAGIAAFLGLGILGNLTSPQLTPTPSTDVTSLSARVAVSPVGAPGLGQSRSTTTPAPRATDASPPKTTLRPTAKPTPKPTPKPTTKPTPKPTPKSTPKPAGIFGNPWGYDFRLGKTIANPPSAFCAYFPCIPSFWESTNGYVVECEDGMFSHSGGRQGVCSHHGGYGRTLYRH